MTIWIQHHLQQNYETIVKAAIQYNHIFDKFRNHSAYTYVVPDTTPDIEIDSIANELTQNPQFIEQYDVLRQMDYIGSPNLDIAINNICTSSRNLKYLYATLRLKKIFPDVKKVIEIGVGYGGLCFTMCQHFQLNGYRLVDLPCVEQLAKMVLSRLQPNITEQFYLIDQPYDLCISECAISELDFDTINDYYNQYLKYSKYLYIKTNFHTQNDFNKFIAILQQHFKTECTYSYPCYNGIEKDTIFGWKI